MYRKIPAVAAILVTGSILAVIFGLGTVAFFFGHNLALPESGSSSGTSTSGPEVSLVGSTGDSAYIPAQPVKKRRSEKVLSISLVLSDESLLQGFEPAGDDGQTLMAGIPGNGLPDTTSYRTQDSTGQAGIVEALVPEPGYFGNNPPESNSGPVLLSRPAPSVRLETLIASGYGCIALLILFFLSRIRPSLIRCRQFSHQALVSASLRKFSLTGFPFPSWNHHSIQNGCRFPVGIVGVTNATGEA